MWLWVSWLLLNHSHGQGKIPVGFSTSYFWDLAEGAVGTQHSQGGQLVQRFGQAAGEGPG